MRFGRIRRLQTTFDKTVADSLTLGLSTIVCSPRPRLRTSDDWKSFADELNKYGERTKAAGLQFGYHNHEIEFVKTPQGDVPWDIVMQVDGSRAGAIPTRRRELHVRRRQSV